MRAIVLLCLLHGVSGYSWDAPNATINPSTPDTSVCLLDQASCGCCIIQKEMQRLERFFNLTADEMNNVLTKSKTSLNNIRASRSAFSVALNNNSALNCFGPFLVHRIVVYKHAFINLGGSYNTQSGFFTVPRTGVYSLTVTIYGIASPGVTLSTCVNLQVTGQVVTTLFEQNGQDLEDSSSGAVTLKLWAGDQVSVNLIRGCFICDNYNHYNTFTGFLLYATD